MRLEFYYYLATANGLIACNLEWRSRLKSLAPGHLEGGKPVKEEGPLLFKSHSAWFFFSPAAILWLRASSCYPEDQLICCATPHYTASKPHHGPRLPLFTAKHFSLWAQCTAVVLLNGASGTMIGEREQRIEQSIGLERLDAKSGRIVSFSCRSCEFGRQLLWWTVWQQRGWRCLHVCFQTSALITSSLTTQDHPGCSILQYCSHYSYRYAGCFLLICQGGILWAVIPEQQTTAINNSLLLWMHFWSYSDDLVLWNSVKESFWYILLSSTALCSCFWVILLSFLLVTICPFVIRGAPQLFWF